MDYSHSYNYNHTYSDSEGLPGRAGFQLCSLPRR